MSKKKKKVAMCDPNTCINCHYVCDGDFLCEKDFCNPVLVISDWMPTEHFLWCKRGKENETD